MAARWGFGGEFVKGTGMGIVVSKGLFHTTANDSSDKYISDGRIGPVTGRARNDRNLA